MTGDNQGGSSSEAPAVTSDPLASYIVTEGERDGTSREVDIDDRIAAEIEAARAVLGVSIPQSARQPAAPRMTVGGVLGPLILGQPLALIKYLPARVSPYRSPATLGQSLMALLAIEMFLCAVVLSAGVMGANAVSVIFVFIAALIVDTVARTGMLFFIYQTYSNLLSFGTDGLLSTPGMAVAVWFMPLVSFFRPCQVVNEIWRASDPTIPRQRPTEWQVSRSSPLVNGWWLSMFIFVPLVVILIADNVDILGRSTYYATMSFGFIVNALMTLLVIHGIIGRQEAKAAMLKESGG